MVTVKDLEDGAVFTHGSRMMWFVLCRRGKWMLCHETKGALTMFSDTARSTTDMVNYLNSCGKERTGMIKLRKA